MARIRVRGRVKPSHVALPAPQAKASPVIGVRQGNEPGVGVGVGVGPSVSQSSTFWYLSSSVFRASLGFAANACGRL